jgi:hypothetical protein
MHRADRLTATARLAGGIRIMLPGRDMLPAGTLITLLAEEVRADEDV